MDFGRGDENLLSNQLKETSKILMLK